MNQSQILQGSLQTEFKTLSLMMAIYCRDKHSIDNKNSNKPFNTLCDDCQALLDYAEMRLDRCPYGEQKPTCNQCPIHCYKPEPKQQMREVMIYAGPRMLLPHPILAIRHLVKERKKAAGKPTANLSNRSKRISKD